MSKQNKTKASAGSGLDERFTRITYDPSFKSMKKEQKKVKIDKRFSGVFDDNKFKLIAKTDKYGNKLEVEEGKNKEMEEFYYRDEQEDDNDKEIEADIPKKDKHTKKQKQPKEDKAATKKKPKKQQMEESEEESDEKDDQDEHDRSFSWHEVSSSEEELEFDDEIDNQEEYHYGVEKERAPVSDKSSSKLALVNYDWQNIGAQDLMLLFNSFKDQIGVIKRVSVYPSDFGLKMLEQEIQQGPTDIWKTGESNVPEENLDHKKQNKDDAKAKPIPQKYTKSKSVFESKKANFLNHTVTARMDDDQCDLDPVKLREYERQRMKYYYAVIECDSKQTAEKIYDTCDGMEFEMSGTPIDLRFIPEEQEFPYDPKEVCDDVPADSQVKSIVNRSIGHTNTRLTWDQPQDRFKFMDGKMTMKDYDKIDWSKYVAPGEEMEDDEDELVEDDEKKADIDSDDELAQLEQEAIRQQQDIDNMNWKKQFNKKDRKKKEGEIEIKFSQGFDDIGNRILERQKKKDETIFETRERQHKEKKQLRKEEIKQKIQDHKNKKKGHLPKNAEETAESRKQRAQLELLVEKEDKAETKLALDDPRFKAIYETNDYALDPTSKFYNKESSSKVLQEQISRRKKRRLNEEN